MPARDWETQRDQDLSKITHIVLNQVLAMTHCPSSIVMAGINTYADKYLDIVLTQEEQDKIYKDIKEGYEVAKGIKPNME